MAVLVETEDQASGITEGMARGSSSETPLCLQGWVGQGAE